MRLLLGRSGFALAIEGRDRWAPYVFSTARAFGYADQAGLAMATAAVECAVGAIDVTDDLVDDEWDLELDRNRALNGSLGLAFLAQVCAAQLGQRARLVGELVAQQSLGSCAGQDLDLVLEAALEVAEERALQATLRKSGSLGALACQVGAALATDDHKLVELVGVFGRHLGTCAQLLNDLAGVDVAQSVSAKSDLRRRKKTVPVAFMLACAQRDGLSWVLDWYGARAGTRPAEEPAVATVLHDLGALHYTWVLADSYYREAQTALDVLVDVTRRPELKRLKRLLPSVRARRSA
ncbi:MAG TPA: polyprenyl synthetase family protein [Chloroflexota bacterium]